MMSNRSADPLYQLIKSLTKAEKRHFKLYIKRSSSKEDLKIIQLFDALDQQKAFDDKALQKKLAPLSKPQISNLKAHLYKQLLASLRLLKTAESTDLQLSEQLDYARLLYHKGLKNQSLRILDKAKELAKQNSKYNFLAQVISLEKKIETLHITRSGINRVENLMADSIEISEHINRVARLSNLTLQLYGWYVQNGHARNQEDEAAVHAFFSEQLPKDAHAITDFYERMYLYQSYCWYAFIKQDFLQYYRYAQKWIDLFEDQPLMKQVEPGHYIKGVHSLLNAHFDLRNHAAFEVALAQLEAFTQTPACLLNDNFRIHTLIYLYAARLNQHLMHGTFEKGLLLADELDQKLEEFSIYIDRHRLLVFHYKMALLHFGSGQFEKSIDYVMRIINGPVDLRNDLHCYARILQLLAHYELGNLELIEPLTKSAYRFMSKMETLTQIEEAMFKFLRHSFKVNKRDLRPELEAFLSSIKHLEKNRFQTRALAYLDIISWVESKLQKKSMSQVIFEKYIQSKHRYQ